MPSVFLTMSISSMFHLPTPRIPSLKRLTPRQPHTTRTGTREPSRDLPKVPKHTSTNFLINSHKPLTTTNSCTNLVLKSSLAHVAKTAMHGGPHPLVKRAGGLTPKRSAPVRLLLAQTHTEATTKTTWRCPVKQQTPQQQPPEQQFSPDAPIRCRRCPALDLIRLHKTRSYDNDVFRCPHCGLIFSPPTVLPVKPCPGPRSGGEPTPPHPPLPPPFVLSAGSRLHIRLPSRMCSLLPQSKDPLPTCQMRPKTPSWTATQMRPVRPLPAAPKCPPTTAWAGGRPPKPPQIAPKTPSHSYGMRPIIPSCIATQMRPLRPLSATKKTFPATILAAP